MQTVKQPQIAGILLAAGSSTRMGQPKALLAYEESSFVDTILNNLQQAGCDPIISILGNSGELICESTFVNNYQCYFNPEPQKGMLSSLKVAIEKLPEDCDGFILSLVDHPAVKRETYLEIIRAAQENPKRIVIPRFYGKNGHPVFFGKQFFETLLQTPNSMGARVVVQEEIQNVHYISVEDEGILKDIDTPEEYHDLIH